jgi:hypothetical protein
MPYLLFRHDDGSADPDLAAVIRQTSYVGDGTASRTIAVDLAGRRPAFALIVPHNGASIFRDPSNTGTTSNLMAISSYTNNASTGITAGGIDSISVGSALNANGITYEVLIFPGGTVAGNGGFSQNGVFTPVETTVAPGSQYLQPGTGTIEEVETPPSGGPPDDLTTDLAANCVDWTEKVCNKALSNIGISQRLVDLGTDNTAEAEMLRLHYTEDVLCVLRDFPWPFATAYDNALVLVEGSPAVPVNDDWTYAHRVPDDFVFARRLVKEGVKREHDSAPYKFRMGGDDVDQARSPDLLYSDQETPILEYTRRPPCAAGSGDAQFREAVAWRLSAHLAPSLSRNKMTADDCIKKYMLTIAQAKQAAANESQPSKEGDASYIEDRN